MADFETDVELNVQIPDRELREARRTIEDDLGDVSVGLGGAGTGGLAADGGLGGGDIARDVERIRDGTESLVRLAEDRNLILEDILDELQGAGGPGDGGDFDLPRPRDLLGAAFGGLAGLALGAGAKLGLPQIPKLKLPDIPDLKLPEIPPLEVPEIPPVPVIAPDSIPLSDPQGIVEQIAQTVAEAAGQAGPREDSLAREGTNPVQARRAARARQSTQATVPEGSPGTSNLVTVPADPSDFNLAAGGAAAAVGGTLAAGLAGAQSLGGSLASGARGVASGAVTAIPSVLAGRNLDETRVDVGNISDSGDPASGSGSVAAGSGTVNAQIRVDTDVTVDPSNLQEIERRIQQAQDQATQEATNRTRQSFASYTR